MVTHSYYLMYVVKVYYLMSVPPVLQSSISEVSKKLIDASAYGSSSNDPCNRYVNGVDLLLDLVKALSQINSKYSYLIWF